MKLLTFFVYYGSFRRLELKDASFNFRNLAVPKLHVCKVERFNIF